VESSNPDRNIQCISY